MKRVLISDKIHQSCIDYLRHNSFETYYNFQLTKKQLKEELKKSSVLIVRSATKVSEEILSHAKNLEVIGRAGTGVDNIDVSAASRKGILVMNTPGGNTISAAEHTLSMILSLSRHIPQANQSMKEGRWDKKIFSGTELYGKKLGVIGLGKIGREVALRAKSFGMEILGYDPLLTINTAEQIGIKLSSLDEIFAFSDVLTLHVPFNSETKNLISHAVLTKLKKGVKIINCARGGIVNEEALINGIEQGVISGAALDVFEEEPPKNRKIIEHSKIICTPHLAASTEEAQEKVALQIAQQITAYLKGEQPKGLVNGISVQFLNDKKLQPYLKLAERMGSIHGQILEDKIKSISLEYYGDYLNEYVEVLTTSFLKGFLSSYTDISINLINAKSIAKEKGIHINEIKKPKHDIYSSLIKVSLTGETLENSIAGVVFGSEAVRIISINDYKLEFNAEGNLLLYYNIDRPGVLAKAGSLIAEAGINIAGVSLSRIEKGSAALTIMNIDEEVSMNLMEKIKKINGIERVFYLRLFDSAEIG